MSETTCVATVFERMIEVVVRIVAARIVSDPSVVVVDVGHVRMPFHIRSMSHLGSMSSCPGRRRAVGRNVTTTEAVGAAAAARVTAATTSALRKGGLRNHQ
jgi:hypothetical protein